MIFTQWFFRITGVSMIANGLWMVFSALPWFTHIPTDMAATGNPNSHLIHDVGIAYIVFGVGLEWCASNLERCRPAYLGIMFFMSGHAIGHAVEILAGELPPSHWWIDFPLVFLPGIILAVLALPQVWKKVKNVKGWFIR
ncbi:MAG: hypothetical protein FVQ83_13770 [Chloroflexi bacterium]|nr:hypothetical protein [Chloroflexota bacterium]